MLVHRSSGRIVEPQDVHFDESELVEPSRIKIETEISQNEAGVKISPDKNLKEKQSDSESDSSVDLHKSLGDTSDDDDDSSDSDKEFEGYGTAGNSVSNTRSSPAPDGDENHSNGLAIEFRATPTSPTDSATSKTLGMTVTHLRNTNNWPTHPYQFPSTQPDYPDEPHRSTRN
jgi:hypothetical protein